MSPGGIYGTMAHVVSALVLSFHFRRNQTLILTYHFQHVPIQRPLKPHERL